MKKIVKKNILTITGVLTGSVAGFLYWKFIGCASGTCFIQSNPVRMILYGALMGGLILNMFQPKTTNQQPDGKKN
jgi:hypothetical protein